MKIDPNVDFDTFQSRNYLSLTRTQKKNQYTESFVKLFNKSALSEAFDGTEDQRMQKIFEDKLRDGSLEIRMTNEQNHAKAYILTNKPDYGDFKGSVFMGSSNFTYNGLVGQVNLMTSTWTTIVTTSTRNKFSELWNDSNAIDIQVQDTPDVEDSFLNQIQKKLWIHATPDPYKIFIRVLHELYAEVEDEDVKSSRYHRR